MTGLYVQISQPPVIDVSVLSFGLSSEHLLLSFKYFSFFFNVFSSRILRNNRYIVTSMHCVAEIEN